MNINEYIGNTDNKLGHAEKFRTIILGLGHGNVIQQLPRSVSELKEKLKEDQYLNNVPLSEWDLKHYQVRMLLKEKGMRSISKSDTVCILKESVRMIK